MSHDTAPPPPSSVDDRCGRGWLHAVAHRVLEWQQREVGRLVRAELVDERAVVRVVELDQHVVEARRVAGHELRFDLVVVVGVAAVNHEVIGLEHLLPRVAVGAHEDLRVDPRCVEHRVGVELDAQMVEVAVTVVVGEEIGRRVVDVRIAEHRGRDRGPVRDGLARLRYHVGGRGSRLLERARAAELVLRVVACEAFRRPRHALRVDRVGAGCCLGARHEQQAREGQRRQRGCVHVRPPWHSSVPTGALERREAERNLRDAAAAFLRARVRRCASRSASTPQGARTRAQNMEKGRT